MPRVRRLRREAPTLELLAATLPQLRLGLSDGAARTLAYEVFEKLGFGAVAVTDTTRVLAFVGAGADHHAPGDAPIRPVFEALAENETRIAPLAFRVACGHSACPLGAAAIVPLRLSDGPVGALIAYATDGSPLADDDVDLLTSLGDQLSAQLQLSELAGSARAAASAELKALQAEIEPHFLFNCLNTIASFIRTDPDRARELVLAFADYCRWTLRRPAAFVDLSEELVHVDAYRLGSLDELDDLDLDASLEESVTVVEWGEGLAERLSDSHLDIRLERGPDTEMRTAIWQWSR